MKIKLLFLLLMVGWTSTSQNIVENTPLNHLSAPKKTKIKLKFDKKIQTATSVSIYAN